MKDQIMRTSIKSLMARTRAFCLVTLALVCLVLVFSSQAQIITLQDGNSIAKIDPYGQVGMFDWTVGGIDQLKRQWFWYRVGSSGPESSIDTISAPTVTQSVPYQATTLYGNPAFSVEVTYLLTGGAASSTLSETIAIVNHTATNLDFHFFQYSDVDLGGIPGDQSVVLNATLARARQTSLSSGFAVETALQNANHREAALVGQTLAGLNDAFATTLNDNLMAGPGDVTFAFQWDYTIAAGDSRIISKIKTVPEPSAIALMALGLLAFTLRRAGAKAESAPANRR